MNSVFPVRLKATTPFEITLLRFGHNIITWQVPSSGARMSRPKEPRTSAVDQAARALRDMAMKREEGQLVGSEDELMTRLGVSRPTLRQAAALVAQEHLIEIKRGVNGGYFTSRPSSITVARIAAIYLEAHDAKLRELVRAVEPIRHELAQLAARNRDPEALAALGAFLDKERALDEQGGANDYLTFLKTERELGRLIGRASGNLLLELFLNITYDLAARVSGTDDVYAHRPDRIEQYRLHRNQMVAAILSGDEEMASLATRRCSTIVVEWMQDDMGSGGFQSDPMALPAR
ncbi:FadR family transcriptional regulator [Sphingomonas crocodyli]|uniref:FadR family transcriptional regulator n=2 Tax=Sphingomonas crocodyli TaxID=1979270 RepID=A0A437MA24_9SPHN|nr:FadR family transcriptional regulator [Sphingomonas crocodyli]